MDILSEFNLSDWYAFVLFGIAIAVAHYLVKHFLGLNNKDKEE